MEKIFQILEVDINATDAEIKKAYFAKIKEFPPDRNPEKFMEIRQAYDQLKDSVARAELKLTTPKPCNNMVDIIKDEKIEKKFVGAEQWLKILESK